ncbi:unnamed protein product (macronuclear) [Paramecium tetraurelia]|uniref:Chromosome undetermined scaffold_12, whole genome shotgun sequence n=1 Tax=Paramecium tetraurelia TaxID=5888 RepID=Q3SE59_PARTE|nr:uncharacterized protein GSPATT00005370001 [Paramecium tetraurelia]CAI39065.1 PAZ and PIWI domain protein [Paramecium tetraurelia]CAK60619.1 unnamed protein product [Paramecium tetraurelia]|eukprot:XP_001428017.1 hypothetical protein (macronuclear) [Paramecium tetraurelia strain d4-2]
MQQQDQQFKTVKVKSNFHQFQLLPNRQIHRYKIELTNYSEIFAQKAITTYRQKIIECLITFYCINLNIYSPTKLATQVLGALNDGEEIQNVASLKLVESVDGGPKLQQILARIVKQIMSTQQGMVQIGKDKLFWPKKSHSFHDYKFEIWEGVQIVQKQFGVVIDCAYKILRQNTLLDDLSVTKEADRYEGMIVMTKYNQKFYRVDLIEIGMSPKDIFITENGEETTFKEYYKQRYNLKLNEKQPLIKTTLKIKGKQEEKVIYLIPELCQLTGLSDTVKSNFSVMREVAKITKPNAYDRIDQSEKFAKQINSTVKKGSNINLLDTWGLKLNSVSMNVEAKTVRPGTLIMGNDNIDLSQQNLNLDQQTQKKMYQVPDQKLVWVLIHYYKEKGQEAKKLLLDNMKQAISEYQFYGFYSQPLVRPLQEERDKALLLLCDDINKECQQKQQKIEFIIFLLPGQKKNSRLYRCAKFISLQKIGCPSQVVLEDTLAKNTRSIVNKIMVQICAKLGGVPWAIDKLPKLFQQQHTMICAAECYDRLHQIKHLAFCSTVDKNMTKYHSQILKGADYKGDNLKKSLITAMEVYKEKNNVFPQIIIIYRDGVSDGQIPVVLGDEFPQYDQAIKQINPQSKLVLVVCNKRVAGKFYQAGHRPDNPASGTIVDTKEICEGQQPNFYLISQITRQGTSQPTLYKILHSDIPNIENDIKVLTYKLCWLYYNFAGPIKIPAPVRYAHCLGEFIGSRYQRNDKDPFVPVEELVKKGVLFYI